MSGEVPVNYARMPPSVRARLQAPAGQSVAHPLRPGRIYAGDARTLLRRVAPGSVALSFWSPPYFVGKSYEADLTFDAWQRLLETVIALHAPVLAPGSGTTALAAGREGRQYLGIEKHRRYVRLARQKIAEDR